jgi:hypothetical protein
MGDLDRSIQTLESGLYLYPQSTELQTELSLAIKP